MEEEYRVALTSSDRERARLEDAIASLEGELKDERRMQAVRYCCYKYCAVLLSTDSFVGVQRYPHLANMYSVQ